VRQEGGGLQSMGTGCWWFFGFFLLRTMYERCLMALRGMCFMRHVSFWLRQQKVHYGGNVGVQYYMVSVVAHVSAVFEF
jgi:hypothetical protein